VFCEITYDDLQTDFYPIQDLFSISSFKNTILSGILRSWLLNFMDEDFEKAPSYTFNFNIKDVINIDYSSSIYRTYDIENDTVLTKEHNRKTEQIKALKSIAGILNDLTPEQMKIFEEAVKRRPLFNEICS